MGLRHSVSIIIPTHNRKEKIVTLINSIMKSAYPLNEIEVIVIDDASSDGTSEIIKKLYWSVEVIRNDIELFPSKCRNLGIERSKGDFVFFVDDDIVLDENTIRELVTVLANYNKLGLVGPIMYYYKNPKKVWCSGVRLFPPIFNPPYLIKKDKRWEPTKPLLIDCDTIPSAFMTKRIIIEEVGLFDENLPIGFEETDFALRIKKKGYKVAVYNKAKVFHDLPSSGIHISGKRTYFEGRNRMILYKKHTAGRYLFFFLDMVIFAFFLLKNKRIKDLNRHISLYVRGVKDGIWYMKVTNSQK
jgi:GT2 family glycosyltransferase